MKKLVLLFAFFTFVGANAFSQTVDEDLLIRLMEAAGFEKSNDEYKTYVAEDGEDSFWKTFYGSNEYIVVAFPEEEGVYDLDLFLYDDNDKEIANVITSYSIHYTKLYENIFYWVRI